MDLKLIFMIILGVVSVFYLILLVKKPGIIQFVLKGCLMPLVLSVYIFGTNKILLPVVLALVFAWIGDILLLKISNLLCFRLGLASFLIGHLCYIVAMFAFTQPFNVPVLAVCAVVAVSLGVILYKLVQPVKEMKIPVIAYETIILTMGIFALQLFVAQGSYFGAFVLAGSVCFVVSDTLLALATFRQKPYNLFVMITYIAAQLLITLGFVYGSLKV
ncbi:MAG: lysoplasmalogenase [Treponema sp.]|jgi:uncharacterized membrane protein YhhN|nr:lysoplasmalogenase [Treponema sp.]